MAAGKLILRRAALPALLAGALLMAAACGGGGGSTDSGGSGAAGGGTRLAIGDAAPDFTLPNANGGDSVSLSGYSGSPVAVVFYRSFFCTFCVRQVNEFRSNYERLEERGIEVVAISSDNLDDFSRLITVESYQFPILYTSLDEAVPRSYDRIGHVRDGGYQGGAELADPGVFLIDGEGNLVWSELGTSIGHFVSVDKVLSAADDNGL